MATDYLQTAVLGVLQGLTEFLPVSSSGHLVLGASILNLPNPGLSLSIMLHLGTAFAALLMLRREIAWLLQGLFAPKVKEHRVRAVAVAAFIVIGSIPAALVAFSWGEMIERSFSSPLLASAGLIVTGFVLWAPERARRQRRKFASNLTPPDDGSGMLASLTLGPAIFVGLAQALAIMPGISRSGSTIVAGQLTGLTREDAARFSFLLSIPAVFGAVVLDFLDASGRGVTLVTGPHILGAAVSFFVGIGALALVFRVVRKGRLSRYAYYCWALGGASLIWSLLRG